MRWFLGREEGAEEELAGSEPARSSRLLRYVKIPVMFNQGKEGEKECGSKDLPKEAKWSALLNLNTGSEAGQGWRRLASRPRRKKVASSPNGLGQRHKELFAKTRSLSLAGARLFCVGSV